MKILNLKQNSPEWLEWRKGKRMASEAAAAMGKSPYTTPLKLARQKRGLDTVQTNFAMQRGTQYEPVARSWFESNQGAIGDPVVMELGEYGASLDWYGKVESFSSGYNNVLCEIKVPQSENSELWKMALNGVVPNHYMIQMQQQLMVSGADYALFCVYMPELETGHIIPVDPSPQMQEEIRKGWDEFWQTYMVGDLPEVADIPEDAEERYIAAKARVDAATAELESIKQELIELCPEGGKGAAIQVIKAFRQGSIDYAKVPQLAGVDLEPYRKKGSSYYTVKEQ